MADDGVQAAVVPRSAAPGRRGAPRDDVDRPEATLSAPSPDRRALIAAAVAALALHPARPRAAEPGSTTPPPIPTDRPVRIGMLLYPGMTALDVVGPHALLAGLTADGPYLVAREAGAVASDTGLALMATHGFADCPRDLDVLFVPGGDGTPAQMRDGPTLDFLRGRAARAAWVASVCTGALILGAAGLLRGYRATSHWCVRDAVLPLLGAEPVAERVVVDRDRATGAGISAGLDLALTLAARLRGPDHARTAQLVAEYAPEPPFRAGTPAEAGPEIVRAADAILAPLVSGAVQAAER